MKMSKARGFTLIELLVVIAIIGILSSVVLASLNSARTKGTDAAIKGEVSNMRAGMEIFFDTNSTYLAATNSAPVKANWDSLVGNRSYVNGTTIFSSASSTGYVVAVQLKSDVGKGFCIDGNGNATTTIPWANVDSMLEVGDGICNQSIFGFNLN